MMVTPFGSGQVIKSHFIEKKYGYHLSKSLPLVFGEKFNDIISFLVIISATLFFTYSFESIILVILFTILICIFLLLIKSKKFSTLILRIMKKLPILNKKQPEFVLEGNVLFESKTGAKTIPFTIVILLLEGTVVYFGFLAFNINLGYIESIQIFYTSILLGTLSFLPGGVGATEGVFVALLVNKNYELELATSLIIFIRLTTIWLATFLGFITSYFSFKKVNTSA